MRVSIITPSYNQLDYLKLCAASVADQRGVEVEHIVQDAGSGEELVNWASTRAGLRFFTEPDSGMYDAINKGLKRASGEICAYLNCDEQYLPGALARVAEFFQEHPKVDVVFGDLILVDGSGIPMSYRRTVLPTLNHIQLAHLNTATCATFFRRTIVDRGFLFDPQWKAIGDAVWIERLLLEKVPFGIISEPLAIFAFTGENLGATELSHAEGKKWKGETSSVASVTRLITVLWHRWRKMWAGAYRRRRVEIDVYTRASPTKRQRIAREQIGFGWPV